MIDVWFRRDLGTIFEKHPVAVVIDESGDAEFLLDSVRNQYTIHTANSEIEELRVKYLIEREQPPSKKFVIYTRMSKDALKYAIITDKKLIPAKAKKDLDIIIGKYLRTKN